MPSKNIEENAERLQSLQVYLEGLATPVTSVWSLALFGHKIVYMVFVQVSWAPFDFPGIAMVVPAASEDIQYKVC